jgi:hypothetical protein
MERNENLHTLKHINSINKKVDNIIIMLYIKSIMRKLDKIEFLLHDMITEDYRKNKKKQIQK